DAANELVDPPPVSEAAAAGVRPDGVGPVVELDRGEQALVGRVALSQAAGAHGVMVLAGPRQPAADAVLERVVDHRHEPQLAPPVLLDRLGDPALVAASQGHAHLLVPTHRDELSSVLGDPGTVVHQNEVEPLYLPAGTGVADRLPGGLLHQRPVPTPVGGPGL